MTIEERNVIGDAWGKPAGMIGPEHFWVYGVGKDRDWWTSLCGQKLEKMEEFAGTPYLILTMENNPIKQDRCEFCLAARDNFDPTARRR